ncbi:MAG: FliI/YscN family ATPase [Acidobacteriota bacterium]
MIQRLEKATTVQVRGRVTEVTGLLIRARVPGVRVGEVVEIQTPMRDRPVQAEVVGFKDQQAFLMGLGELEGIGPDSEVHATGRPLSVPVGMGLLGRTLSGLGEPMDGLGPIDPLEDVYPVEARPPDPMKRRRIKDKVTMGVRVLDACLTIGDGQRVGIFAGAGQGKSTLLGMIARNSDADVNVISLIGERGREVLDFLEESLGPEGVKRSVTIVATSDTPSLVRLKSAYVATAIAEYFRDQGKRVLFMMDSVTRFARAQREVGLAIGEPPARAGFPPSVFAMLPRLLERTGTSERGSITALYTVLVEGDDHNEPVADEVRSILDGHIILSTALAARGHYPAIDMLKSVSRLFGTLASNDHKDKVQRLREMMAAYEKNLDLILIDAYQPGTDPLVDAAIRQQGAINAFLRQRVEERSNFDGAMKGLLQAITLG